MASNFDTREEMLHRRAQMAEADSDRWQRRYRDLLEAFDGLAGRFTSAVRARETYALELRTIHAASSRPVVADAPSSIVLPTKAEVEAEGFDAVPVAGAAPVADRPTWEFRLIAAFGDPPIGNPLQPCGAEICKQMARDGWEFCGVTPGVPHRIAEHCQPVIYLFKRPPVASSAPAGAETTKNEER